MKSGLNKILLHDSVARRAKVQSRSADTRTVPRSPSQKTYLLRLLPFFNVNLVAPSVSIGVSGARGLLERLNSPMPMRDLRRSVGDEDMASPCEPPGAKSSKGSCARLGFRHPGLKKKEKWTLNDLQALRAQVSLILSGVRKVGRPSKRDPGRWSC